MTDKLVFHAPLQLGTLAEEGPNRTYPATMLREGVYTPGVGNTGSHRIRMLRGVIAAMAPSMEGKKVNLEHLQDIDNEVGYCRGVHMAGVDGDSLRGDLVLQSVRARFLHAVAFIEGRIGAGQVPEVSVEILRPVFREASPEERLHFDLDLIGGEFDGCSIVTRGACSADAGCGIGLCASHAAAVAETSGEPEQESEPHMGETNPQGTGGAGSGGATPCGGCAQTSAALRKDLNEATVALRAEQAAHAQTKTNLADAASKLQAFEKAEHDRAVGALKAAAGDGVDLAAVLGCKPEDASVASIGIALRALQGSGARVGMAHAGRLTTGPSTQREAPTTMDAFEQHRKERLGLAESKLPPALRKNTQKLLGKGA